MSNFTSNTLNINPEFRKYSRNIGRFCLPVLDTTPLWDLQWLFYLLPIWWIFGIEQLVWLPALLLITVKVLIKHRFTIVVPPLMQWLLLFLLIYFVSAFFITEKFRLFTYIRNLSTYISALMILFIVYTEVKTIDEQKKMLYTIVITMGIAAIVGIFGITGLFQPEFKAPISILLPNSIEITDYGSRVANKSIGQYSWFATIGTYFRVRSFFLYGTLYASALAITVPIALFLRKQTKKKRHQLYLDIIIGIIFVNLVFTTARMAIISLFCGLAYFLLWIAPQRKVLKPIVILAFFAAVFAIHVLILYTQNPSIAFDLSAATLENVALARGEGSINGRLFVYQNTIEGWAERPIFGWGTERDIPNFPFPAGSHSYYLGILYKQGIAGLFVFLCMSLSLWQSTSYNKNNLNHVNSADASFEARLLGYGRWTIITFTLNSMTDVMDLDALTMMIIWTIFAIITVAKSQLQTITEPQ